MMARSEKSAPTGARSRLDGRFSMVGQVEARVEELVSLMLQDRLSGLRQSGYFRLRRRSLIDSRVVVWVLGASLSHSLKQGIGLN